MDVAGLDDVFEEILHPFDGLETVCKQERYFKECLGFLVIQHGFTLCTKSNLMPKQTLLHACCEKGSHSLTSHSKCFIELIIILSQKLHKRVWVWDTIYSGTK